MHAEARPCLRQRYRLTMAGMRDELISMLETTPNHPSIRNRIAELEAQQPADLNTDAARLKGVWDLRWSSASQPWLRQSPWLVNLQILDPEQGRGCNLLCLRGPMGPLGGISVVADIAVVSCQRVEVCFRKGGWRGPEFPGLGRLKLQRAVDQSFPAWLDITVLDSDIRICRGNAGTIFALLRRPLLEVSDYV